MFLLWLVLLAASLGAQGTGSLERIKNSCEQLLEQAEGRHIQVGLVVLTAGHGRELMTRHSRLLLVPASNMKLLTVGAALLALGPRHLFFTDLIGHGRQRGSRFEGSLRLRGEGDPTLRSAPKKGAPALLAARLAALGLREISGDLLVDDRLFVDQRTGSAWPSGSPTASYLAEVSALALDHGTLVVRARGGASPKSAPAVMLIPPHAGVRLRNLIQTVARTKGAWIRARRGPSPWELILEGRLAPRQQQSLRVALPDPGLVFGRLLAASLEHAGIQLLGRVRRPKGAAFKSGGLLLARLATPLQEVLGELLKHSQNQMAEMLFKHLGAALVSEGSFAGGARAVRRAFQRRGLDLKAAVIRDGSGLSRANRLSAALLSKVLLLLWHSSERDLFRTSLAHGGEGTLGRRLLELGQDLAAKTGTLDGVSALSGYLHTRGGRQLVVALLMNGGRKSAPMRALQDKIMRLWWSWESP